MAAPPRHRAVGPRHRRDIHRAGAAGGLILVAAVDVQRPDVRGPAGPRRGGLGLARVGGEPLALRRSGGCAGGTRRPAATPDTGPGWSPSIRAGSPCPACSRRCAAVRRGRVRRPVRLVWDRRTGLLTPTLRVVPASTWLADRADADTLGRELGWLAGLARATCPMLRWVTVTMDTAPEPGSTLADAVAAAHRPGRPGAARAILGELVAAAPSGRCRRGHPGQPDLRPEGIPGRAEEPDRRDGRGGPGAVRAGNRAGHLRGDRAGPARAPPRSPGWSAPRSTRPPAARSAADPARPAPATGPASSAGPTPGRSAPRRLPDHYRHDSGVSVTWAWHEAPRQNVTADVLARLVAPGPLPEAGQPAVPARSPPPTATRVLEAEVNAAGVPRALPPPHRARRNRPRRLRPGPRPAGRRRGSGRRRSVPDRRCSSR